MKRIDFTMAELDDIAFVLRSSAEGHYIQLTAARKARWSRLADKVCVMSIARDDARNQPPATTKKEG